MKMVKWWTFIHHVHPEPKTKFSRIPDDETSFSVQIQDYRHYTVYRVQYFKIYANKLCLYP